MKNLRTRSPGRTVSFLLALTLAAGVGGAAWAKERLADNVSTADQYQFAQTYRVVPDQTAEQETVVELARVGQVVVSSSCGAGHDQDGAQAMSGTPLMIDNTGPGPVAVSAVSRDVATADEYGQMETLTRSDWIYSTDIEGFWVGGPGLQYTPGVVPPEGAVDVVTFTIMDPAPDGISVTGTLGYSYHWDPQTDSGECVFSVQMKG